MTVFGILLAAGRGRRFDPSGHRSKLEAEIDGEAVAVRACRSLVQGCDRVFAVCRADQPGLVAALRRTGAQVVELDVAGAGAATEGMGLSLAAGARAVAADAAPGDRVLVLPADMPWLEARTVRAIADAAAADDAIVVPVLDHDVANAAPVAGPSAGGGHPVRFPARLLPELAALAGDIGARELLQRHPVHRLVVADPAIARDVDLPSDLASSGGPA
jgi:molybdenum cofactor cytidylyltransferase